MNLHLFYFAVTLQLGFESNKCFLKFISFKLNASFLLGKLTSIFQLPTLYPIELTSYRITKGISGISKLLGGLDSSLFEQHISGDFTRTSSWIFYRIL